MDAPQGEITELLSKMTAGDQDAESRLIPLVYAELRRLAAAYMRSERTDHTLQATALVHEAFMRLKGQQEISWQSRAHFFAVCAQLMRRILVDHARGVRAQKRAGDRRKISLDSALNYAEEQSHELLALDQALRRRSPAPRGGCRTPPEPRTSRILSRSFHPVRPNPISPDRANSGGTL